jgi:hypothetical protein
VRAPRKAAWGLALSALAAGLLALSLQRQPAADPDVEDGRRIFEEGRLPDGRFTQATAYRDVALSGAQVSCANCHGRSGMGTAETGTRTPPITGPMLFNPALRPRGPIYSPQSLRRALRAGVDSSGAPLGPLMPRYQLDDGQIDALIAYLRTLSAETPPGITDASVSLAIPLSTAVPADQRAAVLAVLQRLFDDHNADTRNEAGRNTHRLEAGRSRRLFRRLHLEPWLLDGPSDTWPEQLREKMDEAPVFALVSGLSTQDWSPVHAFCEADRLPCLFPSVDHAPTRPGDFYALYFSDGLQAEAKVMAAELLASGAGDAVVQVLAPRDEAAAAAADTLAARVQAAGGHSQTLRTPEADALVAALGGGATTLVSWLPADALRAIPPPDGPLVLVSGTRLGSQASVLPTGWTSALRQVDARARHPVRDAGQARFTAWARSRSLVLSHPELQAEAWFAGMALLDGMEHIATYPGGAYLLDTLDHSSGLAAVAPAYPQAEFGPGQRTLSKGAWVVPYDGATPPRWVIPQ